MSQSISSFILTPRSPLNAWLKLHFHYNTHILKEDVDVKEGTARVSYFPASNKNILNNIICTICNFFRPKATSVLLRKESQILKQNRQTGRGWNVLSLADAGAHSPPVCGWIKPFPYLKISHRKLMAVKQFENVLLKNKGINSVFQWNYMKLYWNNFFISLLEFRSLISHSVTVDCRWLRLMIVF